MVGEEDKKVGGGGWLGQGVGGGAWLGQGGGGRVDRRSTVLVQSIIFCRRAAIQPWLSRENPLSACVVSMRVSVYIIPRIITEEFNKREDRNLAHNAPGMLCLEGQGQLACRTGPS